MTSKICGILVAACAAIITGCSGSGGATVGDVSGTVTFDGEPVAGIIVTFRPIDGGRSSFGTTDDRGSYKLIFSTTQTGALVGKHNVTISRDETISDDDVNLMKPKNPIPAEYAKATKEVEVKSGSNTIDLAYP